MKRYDFDQGSGHGYSSIGASMEESSDGEWVKYEDAMKCRDTMTDAPLVSAAPDLLAACKSFLDMWHRAGPSGSHQFEKFDGVVRQCRMAVDKATGEDA